MHSSACEFRGWSSVDAVKEAESSTAPAAVNHERGGRVVGLLHVGEPLFPAGELRRELIEAVDDVVATHHLLERRRVARSRLEESDELLAPGEGGVDRRQERDQQREQPQSEDG